MTAGADAGQSRIVVGVDGSANSCDALRWAAHLARMLGARLRVIAAWQYPAALGWSDAPAAWDPAADMRNALVETAAEVFGDDPPTDLELLVHEGSAVRALVGASQDALMLVVGSRGHGGFTGLLLGSVSSNVAEHATCPVLIIHSDQPLPRELVAAGQAAGGSEIR